MRSFADLSTRAKLFLGFGLMFVLLATIVVIAYGNMAAIKQSQKSLYEKEYANTTDLLTLRSNINGMRAALLTMMLTSGDDRNRALLDVKSRSQAGDEAMQRLLERDKSDTQLYNRLAELNTLLASFEQSRDLQVIPLISAGKIAEANTLSNGSQRERYEKLRELAKGLTDDSQASAGNAVQRSEQRANKATNIFLIVGLIALLLGIAMAIFLNQLIASPLRLISGAAQRIALGDLSVAISSSHRRDEVGVLTQTFADMTRTLQGMAGIAEQVAAGDLVVKLSPQSDKDVLGNAFVRMTQSLQEMAAVAERVAAGDLQVRVNPQSDKDVLGNAFLRMTHSLQEMARVAEQVAAGDLKVKVSPQSDKDVLGNAFAAMVKNLKRTVANMTEAVSVLSSSASQISASTTELAASSAETAAAVNETTATVEEIRQTAQVASQKARGVAESAQNASRISLTGKQATEETIVGMKKIHEQMESVAGSMVRLSEQSQAIGNIITAVDDLAQQSNLLAVNAAIEAAKAGEQGKGFAVVAQEVKSLAEQSRQATAQVRTILSDIQKATSAAVMATEQGSKAVETGLTQSVAAGDAISALSESVSEAAQAALQISASSQQQLVGMDQVALAMESVRQASSQNVEGARQLEAAARGLTDLGQQLKQQVEQFSV